MKAMELRIGDYVNYRCDALDIHIPVYQVGNGADIQVHENHGYFSPIPLTEEWLLKFGFYRVENGYYGSMPYNKPCWIKFSFTILIWDDGTFVYDWNGGNTILKSVHQLQNLHFALKGKELTIKS